MSSSARAPMGYEEFLAWEDRQELRYEFDGTEPRAMTGGTLGHDDITFSLRAALSRGLDTSRCRARGPNAMVRTIGDRVRYPDAVITCTPAPPSDKVAPDPVAVFEVVSPSTSSIDRVVKLREYQAIPSVQHYVLLEQDAIAATVLHRRGHEWVVETLVDDDVLSLPAVDVRVPLRDCYLGVELGA